MEVGDWGDAPQEDYPSFNLHTELPATSNARKKAKLKRKQLQEQQEAQLKLPTPIQQVAAPDVDISKSAKQESGERQKSHTKHSKQNQVSKRRVATNGGVPFVVDSSSLLEDSLSTADMSKLVELAQRAKQHNPDLIEDADQLPGITPSDNAKPADSASAAESLPASDEKIQKQARLSDSDAKQPKAKRPNSATGTTMPAGDGAPARPRVRTFDTGLSTHKLAAGGAAAATAAMVAAALAGGTASEDTPAVHIAMTTNEAAENGADVKAKGGKLGRKARLRLKRQVWRQKQEQQQQSEAVGTKGTSQPFVSGTKGKGNEKGKLRVSEQPGTGLTAPAKAAQLSARLLKAKQQTSASEQPSQVKKKLSSKQAASAVDASVADALAVDTVTPGAKVTGQEGKAHQKAAQQGSPAAEATVAADQKRLAHKKSKGGLLDQMRSKLSGGRFRMLNEQLYTAPGQEAFETMQGDPALFEQYHEGFREQTQHWPVQPIDLAIAWMKKQSPGWVAADFGCGDAQLASCVPQQVHSFDLVATTPAVTACNMAQVPIGDASVNAAIFCLALMGTDYGSFLQEAYRVLRPDGLLWIAEVRSRFVTAESEPTQGKKDEFANFVKALKAQGYQVMKQDASNKMFVVFVAKKARQSSSKVKWPILKPCLYKRR